MGIDILLGALPEGDRLSRFESLLGLLRASGLNGIDALLAQPPVFVRQLTRLLKADNESRAKSHMAAGISEYPRLRALAFDLQPKIATIAVHAGLFHARDKECR